MADVRLTAINPEDSSVVPVACNAKGELLLEAQGPGTDDYVAKSGDVMTGPLKFGSDNSPTLTLDASAGSVTAQGDSLFEGRLRMGDLLSTNDGSYLGDDAVDGGFFRLKQDGAAGQAHDDLVAEKFRIQRVSKKEDSSTNTNEYTVNMFSDGSSRFRGLMAVTRPYHQRNDVAQTWGFNTGGGFNVALDKPSAMITAKGSFYTTDNYSESVSESNYRTKILSTGQAYFGGTLETGGEVTVTSRNQKWVLTEQGGICYMMTPSSKLDEGFSQTPPRDVIKELDYLKDLVQALYERLHMTPSAGWDVWDGSD